MGKDIKFVQNLYWNQEAAVRVEDTLTAWINILGGLRQGCVQSPDFFQSLQRGNSKCNWGSDRLEVGGNNFNNLRYADDTAMIATSEEEFARASGSGWEASAEMCLTINCDKIQSQW